MMTEAKTPIPGRRNDREFKAEWTRGFLAGVDAGAVQADYEAALKSGARWEPMTGDDLRRIRTDRFAESREAFSARCGVPVRSLERYERGESPVPAWMNLVVAALLYDLPPYRPEEGSK